MSRVLCNGVVKSTNFKCASVFQVRNIGGIVNGSIWQKNSKLIVPKNFQGSKDRAVESLGTIICRNKSFGGYSNFGHRDESTPLITKFFHTVVVLSMVGALIDWEFAFNYWKEDLRKKGYLSSPVIEIGTPELVACSDANPDVNKSNDV